MLRNALSHISKISKEVSSLSQTLLEWLSFRDKNTKQHVTTKHVCIHFLIIEIFIIDYNQGFSIISIMYVHVRVPMLVRSSERSCWNDRWCIACRLSEITYCFSDRLRSSSLSISCSSLISVLVLPDACILSVRIQEYIYKIIRFIVRISYLVGQHWQWHFPRYGITRRMNASIALNNIHALCLLWSHLQGDEDYKLLK